MNRMFLIAAAALAGTAAATPAAAQRVWQDGRWVVMPHRTAPRDLRPDPQRWGTPVNGRWDGGTRAPGGWNAYRRLGRGAALPGYWMRPDFRVPDYLRYGLGAPPQGYFWVRYYDDAVLVDGRGQVWDTIGGIGWSGGYASAQSSSESYAGAGYVQPQPIQPVDPNAYYAQSDGYDAPIPYPAPYPDTYAPPVAPALRVVQQVYPAPCVQACGGYQGGGYQVQGGSYYGGGYGYAAGAATTVIITPAPVVTTTVVTEEIVEEVTTTSYVRAAPAG
ncbi:RcnB family protein [Sphingomonas hengshuiensis]|uniref:RcnB family protein n=1 Tax=Sphingomonas hengshuiensis TaxID=1609977 RepID=UPI000698E625|nr:RcnB family protein [Sphingomonas hengshuiensis]